MELRDGYKKTEFGVIPIEWSIERLDLISKRGTGHTPSKKFSNYYNGGIVWVSLADSEFLDKGLIDKSTIEISKIGIQNSSATIHPKGTVLMSRDAGIGKSAVAGVELAVSQHFITWTCIEKILHNWFLYHWLQFKKSEFERIAVGSTIKTIGLPYFEQYQIPIPPINEQYAIVSALRDTDALINSLEKLIEKKRNIKQGVMQELLKPKDGWVVKKIEDIASVGRGRVISHKEIALSTHFTYPVYSSQTTNNGIMGYIDTFDFDGEYVTWTTDGENAGTVFYRNGKFNCTNVCGTIKIKTDNARFVSYFLNTVTSTYVSKNLANPKLMNDAMKKIEIHLPIKEEQDQIANIILDIENEIFILEKKLYKSKMIKQGMMQELLTGKIRLI